MLELNYKIPDIIYIIHTSSSVSRLLFLSFLKCEGARLEKSMTLTTSRRSKLTISRRS
jgi:hypothetical protein